MCHPSVASLTSTPDTVLKLVGPVASLILIVPVLAATGALVMNETVYVALAPPTVDDNDSVGEVTGAPKVIEPVCSVGPTIEDVCATPAVETVAEPLRERGVTKTVALTPGVEELVPSAVMLTVPP
jgi:hypothetical protein